MNDLSDEYGGEEKDKVWIIISAFEKSYAEVLGVYRNKTKAYKEFRNELMILIRDKEAVSLFLSNGKETNLDLSKININYLNNAYDETHCTCDKFTPISLVQCTIN